MANCYIAEIRPFTGPYTMVPAGWHLCDGTLLPIAGNEALFSLVSTSFGGDGVTTFGLPDLRGRLPIGSGQGAGITNNYAYASKGGAETITLTTTQMPAHTHAFTVTTAAATASNPSGQLFANPNPNVFYATTPGPTTKPQVLLADTVDNQGGSQPHENRMPSVAVNYIIALNGVYPVRP